MTFSALRFGVPLVLAGALLAGCNSDQIGPAQEAPGPMGSTETPSTADLPAKNSQSTPIIRPE